MTFIPVKTSFSGQPAPGFSGLKPEASRAAVERTPLFSGRTGTDTVSTSGQSPQTAAVVLKKLQGVKFLHAAEKADHLKKFTESKNLNGLDLDIRLDDKTGEVLVSHLARAASQDSGRFFLKDLLNKLWYYILNKLSFDKRRFPLREWLESILSKPDYADKLKAVKIDIKEKRVIQPLVKLMTTPSDELKGRTPLQALGNRTLILNANIPVGGTNKGSKIALEDLQTLKKAFPNAVLSLGINRLSSWADLFQPTPDTEAIPEATLKALDETLSKLDGVKTVSLHLTTRYNPELMNILKKRNAFPTLWANNWLRDFDRNRQDYLLSLWPKNTYCKDF